MSDNGFRILQALVITQGSVTTFFLFRENSYHAKAVLFFLLILLLVATFNWIYWEYLGYRIQKKNRKDANQ